MAKFKGHVIFTKEIDFEFNAEDKFDANEKMKELDHRVTIALFEKVASDPECLKENVTLSNKSFHYEFVPIRENIEKKEKN